MPQFSRSMYRRSLSTAITVSLPLFLPVAAQAQESQSQALTEVVVSATRVEQDTHDVASTVTTLSAERIEREQATDIDDLLRYETGVSVRDQPSRSSGVFRNFGRGGNEGINVRGLEGNQVLLQVDGVRLPAFFDNGGGGPFVSGRGDYIDVEAFKRVEILRGPSSSAYGSDGLAGAVSFVTKDPSDLLTLGKPLQGATKLAYSSASDSWSFVPSVAFGNDAVRGLVLASLRRGHETKNKGGNDARNVTRTKPNPSSNESDYILAKLVVTPGQGHEIKFTVDLLDRHVDTDVYSFFGDPFGSALLTGVDLTADIERQLYKLDYKYTPSGNPLFQSFATSVYHQASENRQIGRETRSAGELLRVRDTLLENEVDGLSLQFESRFGQAVTHRLVYGADATSADVSVLYNGQNTIAVFVPNKPFPDTDTELFGAFIQDEIGVGPVSIIPGLRYDKFKLKPHADALYEVNNTVPPVTLDSDDVSPKLGLIWKLSPLANAFAQYAHGFRAPSPEQVNGSTSGFSPFTGTYYTGIGNPNLKPETSDTVELGLRGRSSTLRYSASVFNSEYKNFIDTWVGIGGSGAVDDPLVYQSINRTRVEISGFEARGEWSFRPNWTVTGSYAHAKGDDKTGSVDVPLRTVDPDKLVLGLVYNNSSRFGGQVTLTAVERKKRNPDPGNYIPAGYEVVDLSGWYNFGKRASVSFGVFNLFDKKYFQWADVRGLGPTHVSVVNNAVDAYSQSGRNFGINLRHQL